MVKLNWLESWDTDAGNACLEAKTKEKVFIIAGSEFGDLKNHVLLIKKALYGLRTSGLRWHDRLADYLRDTGFFPCKMEPGIWMRQIDANEDHHYKHVAVHTDDLLITSKSPQNVADLLINKCNFKLKDTGPIKHYLGCDFAHDKLGIWHFVPRDCVEKTHDAHYSYFGSKPSTSCSSSLEEGDHPGLDAALFLD